MGIAGRISILQQNDKVTDSHAFRSPFTPVTPLSPAPPRTSLLQGFSSPAIWAAPLLVIVVISAILAVNTYRAYHDTAAQEFRVLEAQALAADAQMSGALRGIDLLLQRVAEQRSASPARDAADLDRLRLEWLKPFPEIRLVLTTDETGRATGASSRVDPATAEKMRDFDASERDYFKAHRDASAGDERARERYLVSRPLTTVAGVTVIVVSRAIRGADGRFLGVVAASLAPAHFHTVLEPAVPADAGRALLLNSHGDILYALPRGGPGGILPAPESALVALAASGDRVTRHFDQAVPEDSRQLSVLRQIHQSGLAVMVSRDAGAVFGAWRRNAIQRWLSVLVAAVVALLLIRVAQRRQREALAAKGFSERLIETASVMVVGLDAAGKVCIFNTAAEGISGYRRDEMLGRNWFQQVMPRKRYPHAWQTFARLPAGDELPRTFESPLLTKDGRERIIAWQNTVINYPGSPVTSVSFGLDITEHIDAREALKRSEANLNRAQRVAHLGSWHLDVAANSLEWSAETYRIFGVPQGKRITLEDFVATIHPDDRQFVLDQWHRALAGEPYNIEHRILVGGEVRWINERADLVLDENGVLVGGIGTAQDITEQKAAEERIRRGEQYLRQLMDESPLPMLVLNNDTQKVEFVNQRFTETLGYAITDIPDLSHWWPLAYPDPAYRQQVLANWNRRVEEARLKGSAITPAEVSVVCRNGETRILDIRLTTIGERSLVVIVDLTQHRRTEQELRAATERAESASRGKSEFLANMSHEIRTPMNAIIGLSQLALDEPLDPTLKDYLGKINGAARALLGILNDILDYSKIEAGRLHVESTEFSLDQVLRNISTLFSFSAEEKGLQLTLRIAPDVPRHLIGDPLRLTQILSNLISNAVKFTPRGEVVIEVASVGQAGDLARLRFTVRDSGIGIAPETLARLFQPFVQGDNSITRRYGGTGLGLIITRHLIDLMRGELRVKSQEGSGSTFTVEIPFGLVHAESRQGEAADGATPAIRGFDTRRLDEIVDGDRDLLRGLLQAFCDDHAGAAEAMASQLAVQEYEGALRRAHNIKGSAANLGAASLSRAAHALERLLASGAADDALQPALLELGDELKTVLDAAAAFLAQTETAPADARALVRDRVAALALCRTLAGFVAAHELIPAAQLTALRSALNGYAATALQKLEASLAHYDFAAAHDALAAIESELL